MSQATQRYFNQRYRNITGLNFKVEYKLRKPKRLRSAFTTEQVQILEEQFQIHPYIENGKRKEISQILKITERAVKIWFQNRRMKAKKDAKDILNNSNTQNTDQKLDSTNLGGHNVKVMSSSSTTSTKDSTKLEVTPKLQKELGSSNISRTNHTDKVSDIKHKPTNHLHTKQKLVGKIHPTIFQKQEKLYRHSSNASPKIQISMENQRLNIDRSDDTRNKWSEKVTRLKASGFLTQVTAPRYYGAGYLPRNIAWRPVNTMPFVPVLKPTMLTPSHSVTRFKHSSNNSSRCFCPECKLMAAMHTYTQRRVVSIPYIVSVPYSGASPKL